MSFRILISPKVNNFLRKLETSVKIRIESKLKGLSDNPELGKPLVGKLARLWSLRIGDYRIIYQIRKSELLILVLKIGHRKKIYD